MVCQSSAYRGSSPGDWYTNARRRGGERPKIGIPILGTGRHPLALAYATNGLNQYTATVPPAQPGATFAYDANGSLVSEPRPGGARQLYYDVENRLIWASGSPTAAIVYDPLGRLHHLVGGSAVTTFLYDGDALVAEYDGAGIMTARYVHGVGADVPMVEYRGVGTGTAAADRRNLIADHQGSIVAVSSNAGARLSINAYDEYGVPATANTGRFQYTGQIWLAELGLYHYKARVYSPELGRFLQTDPVGYEDQFNLYTYVGNDPVNLTDPTGMCLGPFIIPCAVGAADYIVPTLVILIGVPMVMSGPPEPPDRPDYPASDRRVSRNDNNRPPDRQVASPNPRDQEREARRLERSAASKSALAADHERRAAEFARNPTVRPGMEQRGPAEIAAQQRARIDHLRREAAEFRRQAASDLARARRLRRED